VGLLTTFYLKTNNNISGTTWPAQSPDLNTTDCILCNYTEATYWNRCDQIASRVGQRSLQNLEVPVYWIYS